jgi:aspartyl-tRNA(Asn)/glutamyl-tRNA(Gln) amidotransferase subunit A
MFWDMAEESARDPLNRTVDVFKARGAIVREVDLPTSFANVLRSHMVIMSVEAAAEHAERFGQHAEDYLPKIRGLVEAGLHTSAPDYVRAKQHQQLLSRDILACFHDADVLLTPATIGPAPDCSTTGDPAFNSPWSFTGLPTVSFPVALAPDGLPLALQLVGCAFAETELFRCALWCEQAPHAQGFVD